MTLFWRLCISLFLMFQIIFASGCATQIKHFEEFEPYHPNDDNLRLPTVFVPGIKGSRLLLNEDNELKEIWGVSWRASFICEFDELKFKLSDLSHDNIIPDFKSFYFTEHHTTVGSVLDAYKISLPWLKLFKIPIYNDIKEILEDVGGYRLGIDLFQFSYDWRLDNRFSAVMLAKQVSDSQSKFKEGCQEKYGNKFRDRWNDLVNKYSNLFIEEDGEYEIKVNIIAHSMGGLVSRYYLQMLGGYKNINKLIMLGSPNQGSMETIQVLAEGEYPEAILHFYDENKTRKVVYSWPSVYQLLPRYKNSLIAEDGTPVKKLEDWGLGNSDLNKENLNQAVKNWEMYNLIPANFDDGESYDDAKQFLLEQLENASKFYQAINGTPDMSYETIKLEQIKTFYRGEEDGLESIVLSVPNNSKAINSKIIVFGGNCKKTVKTATLSPSTSYKKAKLLFDEEVKGSDSERDLFTFGDGRVPIVSLEPEQKNNNSYRFLICEDHVGLVKNTTFQYNLLHELLEHNNR